MRVSATAPAKPGKAKPRACGHRPGRVGNVTLQVVRRVGRHFGRGVPLRVALAAEPALITEEAWHAALQRHPHLAGEFERHKARFLTNACKRLDSSKELQNLRWLLSRRHPDLFAERIDVKDVTPRAIPEEVVQKARELLAGESAPSPTKAGQ